MSDRILFNEIRRRAFAKLVFAVSQLSDPDTKDRNMAPHVAREKVLKLRVLAEELIVLSSLAEKLT